MNVKQLIEILSEYHEDTIVLHSSDSEGNYISPAYAGGTLFCDQHGELVEVAQEDYEEGEYEGWDVQEAVIVW